MLSYQHGYHAGNAADVLKHFILFLVLQSLKKKDTPFHFYDTHAGAGAYSLESSESLKTGEADSGIKKLLQLAEQSSTGLPSEITLWLKTLDLIQTQAKDTKLYPGSPYWAQHLMREQDRATLLELHPIEYQKLRDWKARDKRIKTFPEDSFKDFKSHLPPRAARGVILIDPPYELRSDYLNVTTLLVECLKRFAHGIYLIWYPVVERGNEITLLRQIKDLQIPKTLLVEINFRAERYGLGIAGTGLIIINCPWQIDSQINSALPWLANNLGDIAAANYRIDWLVPESLS